MCHVNSFADARTSALEQRMDIFSGRYYKLNYFLLAIIGQWPYQTRRTMLILRLLVTSLFFSAITVMILKYITEDFEMDLFIEITLFIVILIIFWLKYLSYWIYTDKLMLLMEQMKRDWKSPKSEKELQILEDTAEESRLYNLRCVYYVVFISVAAVTSIIMPNFLNVVMPLDDPRPREFIFQGNYIVDSQKYYYPIMLHMIICLIMGFIVLIATDTMYATYVHHACGMFSIAGYYLEHVFDTIVETSMEKEIHHKIKSCVEYHRKAIRFANAINSLYEWVMFVTLLLVIGNISLTLYYVVISTSRSFQVVRAVANMLTQITQLFFDIYPGQKLIDRSANIFRSVYNSKWYAIPVGTQKLLLVLMHASMTPSQITLGRLVVFSSETYSSVVQTAVSYFTVLYSTRQM